MWIKIPILLPHRFHEVLSLRDYVAWFWLRGYIEFLKFDVTVKKKIQIRLNFKSLHQFLQNLASNIKYQTQY